MSEQVRNWYLADYGRGGVEIELGLWWLRVCRGPQTAVRPPLSPAGLGLGGGEEEPCPALGSQ